MDLVLELLVDTERYQSLYDQKLIGQLLRREWALVEAGTGWFGGKGVEWTGQILGFIHRIRNSTLPFTVFTHGSSFAWQQ